MSAIFEAPVPSADLPNPLTPMAFLPPNVAFQLSVKSYVAVGTAAVRGIQATQSLHRIYISPIRFLRGMLSIGFLKIIDSWSNIQ